VGAARSLIALDRLIEARTHSQAATELLQWWSGWRVDQAEAVRSRLGLRPVAEPIGGGATLTPREREVALLIAEGLTNAELARRLYISPRTAAVHVSNILRKLEVGSRTEVAAALRS
jgi:DNA-binding NarL/FixJ family response regulator